MASKSKKKPPTSIIPGDDARRWREGAAAPRDAEIILHFHCHGSAVLQRRSVDLADRRAPDGFIVEFCEDLLYLFTVGPLDGLMD